MIELEPYNEWIVEGELMQVDWKIQLTQGNCFIKHHRWGKAKLRHIWVDKDFQAIYWSELNNKCNKKLAKGNMKIKDIREVREGLVKSRIRDKRVTQRKRCSFALVSKSRTLELECPTEVRLMN